MTQMDEIEKNNLICVQTSLYSMDESIHDEITQKKGSLVQTLRAVNRLIASNIPLQVSCPIMRQKVFQSEDIEMQNNTKFQISKRRRKDVIAQYMLFATR